MAFEDIGKQVGMNMDAYRGNPGALEQQVNKPAARKNSGLQAPLVKLLALQQLKQEQKTKEDQIKLQMMQQGQAPSIKDQVENDAIQRSVDETTKGIMGALNQQAMAKKKAQNRLLANATKFQQPTNPMAMMNRGIAGNRRNNMRSMAQGGIVGFKHGGPHNPREVAMQKIKEKIKAGEKILNPDNIAPFAKSENQSNVPSSNYIAPSTLSSDGNPIDRFGKLNENTNLGIESVNPIDRRAAALANVTAPNLINTTTEGDGGPPTLDTSTPEFTTKVGPNFNYMGRPGMPTNDPKKKPENDGSGKPVGGPGGGQPGGLQGLFDQRMKDAMADEYGGHEWMRPGGMMDFFRGLASGQLTGPADAMRVGKEQAYNRALKRASAGMDYATADAKIAAQILAAQISAAARAAASGAMSQNEAVKNLNAAIANLQANVINPLKFDGEFKEALNKALEGVESLEGRKAAITKVYDTFTQGDYSKMMNDIEILRKAAGMSTSTSSNPPNNQPNINSPLFDKNQQDKTVVQKTP